MELERSELHEANSRIATLAFSQARTYYGDTYYGATGYGSTDSGSTDSGSALLWQAGVPMEEAHQQLMDVLMPHTAARKADERCKQQDAEAA
eukprot:scaffold25712_cov36-Phaeocystis_antarctica.AAC.1